MQTQLSVFFKSRKISETSTVEFTFLLYIRMSFYFIKILIFIYSISNMLENSILKIPSFIENKRSIVILCAELMHLEINFLLSNFSSSRKNPKIR